MGHQHPRHRHPARREAAAAVPQGRADPRQSLGTEAAAQLKLDRFNKETTIAQNKKAIQLLRDAGIVTEAQFIVGLENETAETLEETYRMALDWKPDMANWAMYTPWPFSDLFQELGDKVEVFDFEKYNFVTPIMKPDAMERGELLDRVMNNYRRFFMSKSFFQYPWEQGQGCGASTCWAASRPSLKSGFQRTFYDLGRVGYWGPQTKKTVDFGFDKTRTLRAPDAAQIASDDAGWVTMHGPKIEHKRRKGELRSRRWPAAAAASSSTTPKPSVMRAEALAPVPAPARSPATPPPGV